MTTDNGGRKIANYSLGSKTNRKNRQQDPRFLPLDVGLF
jgi:hypothetical protein